MSVQFRQMSSWQTRMEGQRVLAASVLMICVLLLILFVPLFRLGEQHSLPKAGSAQIPLIPQVEGSTYNPLVRVNITPTATDSIEITIDGAYQVHPVGDSRRLSSGVGLARTAAEAIAGGICLGGTSFPSTRVEIIPAESPAVWVNGRQYRGTIRLFRQSGGTLVVVNALPLEDYVASVVDSEMPTKFSAPARRAQAVVARTYALYQITDGLPHPLFDVYADTRSQKYLGYQYRDSSGRLLAGESADSRQIARETAGLVCTAENRLFCTYYSAVCGGHTTNGRAVFSDANAVLHSVSCDWCRESPLFRWDRSASKASISRELHSLLKDSGNRFGTVASMRLLPETRVGEIPRLAVSDGVTSHTFATNDLRRALTSAQLPSPFFEADVQVNEVHFRGRGNGHGVGLCQWGARGQGHAGQNFLQILAYYYPGSRVVRLRPPGS